jgi:hypothetical protein
VLLGGIAWQAFLTFKKDKRWWQTMSHAEAPVFWKNPPQRMIIPAFFGLAVFLGFTGYQIIRVIDGKVSAFDEINGPTAEFWNPILKSLVFALILQVKTYFGPLLTCGCISWSLYHYFEYDELLLVLFLQALLDWVFSAAPRWLEIAYVVVLGVYALGSSLNDAVTDVSS